MTATAPSERSRVRRAPKRADYDRETIDAILDEALVAHLGFVADGQPYVIPTLHARVGDEVLIHGSAASRMVRTLGSGVPACLTVTLIDGLVLARSAFHHSINYRSVVIHGVAREVTDEATKQTALAGLVDAVVPGRSAAVRGPSVKELRATTVLRLDLRNVSLKSRSGPPGDDGTDLELPYWAGVIPISTATGQAQPAPDLAVGIPVPAHVSGWARP